MDKANIYLLILIFLIKVLGIDNNDEDVVKIIGDKTLFEERGNGAHYYAFSPYLSGYTKATSYIQLPDLLNNGKRNAYISFGVFSLIGVDVGIVNTGTGWHPYYLIPKIKNSWKEFYDDVAPSNTKIVGIEVEVTSNKKIKFSITYRTSDLSVIKSFTTVLEETEHVFEKLDNNVIKCRFYRFASLVPKGKEDGTYEDDDHDDGTYMKDGQFTHLAIVRNNNVRSWGLGEEDIELAWKVYPSNIEINYQGNNDTFSIIHKNKQEVETQKLTIQTSGVKNHFIYLNNFIKPFFTLLFLLFKY